LFASFFLYRLHHNLIKQIDQILHDEALELINRIEKESDLINGCARFEEGIAQRKSYPLYFRALDTSGALLYASDMSVKKKPKRYLSFPPPVNQVRHSSSFRVPNRSDFRCYQQMSIKDGIWKFTIQIATPTSKANKVVRNLRNNILRTLPVIIFLSIAFGLYASRKPFEIITKINKITKRITSRNLSQRLPVPSAESEVKNLTETINSMLDRLERSFNEVKQFTSDVSHELRNPLSAVKGEMEVALSEQRTKEEYKEVLSECMERINDLIKIVNSLLLISRFDSNKITLDLDSVNLSEIVNNMCEFFQPIAQEKHLKLEIERNDNIVLKADRTRMQQVISNLIDNAIKFTPQSGSIYLSLIKGEDKMDLLVRDNGIGIPDGEISNIFKRFYQVEDSRSDSNSGSGLGLPICKRIVDLHGGNIRAERNKEAGMTFIVTIPMNL
jgi:heavy metal sensor kinase